MEKAKAKFNVTEITKYGNGGGTKVKMSPVIGGSEENEQFFNSTPSGEIELHLADSAGAKFEHGEYYVEFTKA